MPSLENFDLSQFWDESEFALKEYQDEPLTDELVTRVEHELGYKLPLSYVALCRSRNGGAPLRNFHYTSSKTWGLDHLAVENIKAIGFENAWALGGAIGHQNYLDEWGYPPIGVYFGDTPSGGHDALCLDYRNLRVGGEPSVVHVDQESGYLITPVADTFEAFLRGLEPEEAFDLDNPRNANRAQ